MRGETDREIRALKEIIAVKKSKREVEDWGHVHDLQAEVCIPEEFRFLEDWNLQQLEKRLERLQRRSKEEFEDE